MRAARWLPLLALFVGLAARADHFTKFKANDKRPDAVLFRLKPGSECTGNALSTTKGTAITFARSSSGVCTTTGGTLVTLTSNKPRTNGAGLLVEGAGTNKLLRSEQLDNASWTVTTSGSGSLTITADTTDVTDPYGTNLAEKLVFGATSGSDSAFVGQSFSSASASSAGSIYLRTATGTATVYLWFKQSTSYFKATCSVTSSWTRCVDQTGSLAAATDTFNLGVDLGDGTQTGQPAMTIYALGGQIEQQNSQSASSYIATVGTTVTRSADIPTVSGIVFGTSVSAAATVTLTQYTSDQGDAVYWLEGYGGGSDQIAMKVTSAGKVSCVVFNGTLYTTLSTGTVTIGTPTRVGCTFASGAIQACIAGTCNSGAATLTTNATYPVSIGMSNGSSTRWLRGVIANICIDNTLTGCTTT